MDETELRVVVADAIEEIGSRSFESVAEVDRIVGDVVCGLRLSPRFHGLVIEMVKDRFLRS